MIFKVKFFVLLCLFLPFITISQCWKNLDIDGDSNSVHYAIRVDGSLWLLPSFGNPNQIPHQKKWEKCFTSRTYYTWPNLNSYNTFLLAEDSTLWGMGGNERGELGIGDTLNHPSIVQLNNSKWIDFCSGDAGHSFAIRDDNTLWQWGGGTQLLPLQIGTDSNWIKLHSSGGYYRAIKSNGTLWSGSFGSSPLQVGTDSDWREIWTYWGIDYAIKNNGTLWENNTMIGNDSDWVAVKYEFHTGLFALKADGSLWFWSPSMQGANISSTPTLINLNNSFIDFTLAPNSSFQQYLIYAISSNKNLWYASSSFIIPSAGFTTFSQYDSLSVLCTTVGYQFKNNDVPNIQIMPNPVKNTLTVKCGIEIKNSNYEIFDLCGRKLLSGEIFGKEYQIDISLPNGMFILKIDSSIFKIYVID